MVGVLVFLLAVLWPLPVKVEEMPPSPPISLYLERIPPRPANAITGGEFARSTRGFSGAERQQAALDELRRGNVPDFMRQLKPVRLQQGERSVLLWVTPDYLAIGSDQDFLRIPLTYPSAVAIAGEFGCVLPTRKMVDSIYAHSEFHFRPQPMRPGPRMRSSEYYLEHQQKIEKQRQGRALGELVSGHKKDVVLTNRLHRKPGRIAIYGWHRGGDDPIQPLSTVHGARYADYSHGIRLVFQKVWIDGREHSIYEVLQDPQVAALLTYEEKLEKPRTLMRRLRRGDPAPGE